MIWLPPFICLNWDALQRFCYILSCLNQNVSVNKISNSIKYLLLLKNLVFFSADIDDILELADFFVIFEFHFFFDLLVLYYFQRLIRFFSRKKNKSSILFLDLLYSYYFFCYLIMSLE